MASKASITNIINLIDRLSDLTEEQAAEALAEYNRTFGVNESVAAIFKLADIMRNERAATLSESDSSK